MSPRDRSCSSPWTATCVEERKVPQSRERVSTSLCFEQDGRKRPLLPFIFSFFHNPHFPLGNILVYSLIPEIEEWFHTQTWKSTSGSSTSPMIRLLFKVTDFVPFPQTRQCLLPALCLLSKDARQERKRSLLFSSLYIQGLPAWLPLLFQWGKDRIHCFCFSTGTVQLLFFNVTEHHWWTPTLRAHKRTGKS